jgi:polyphosphate kinase
VRGICCIKAGVPGKTDGLIVRQIVGRFLEHARVYSFGVDADTIYLSSADMMTRNTERRVEIAYPVLDPTCRKLVTTYMDLQLADNVKARQLTAAGTWEKIPIKADEPRIDAQAQLEVRAYKRATEAADAQSASHKHRSPTSAERAAVHKAPSATRPKASSFPTSVPNSKATGVEAPRRGRLQRALGLIGEGFKMLFGGQ